jgi:hypothetical protein
MVVADVVVVLLLLIVVAVVVAVLLLLGVWLSFDVVQSKPADNIPLPSQTAERGARVKRGMSWTFQNSKTMRIPSPPPLPFSLIATAVVLLSYLFLILVWPRMYSYMLT